MAERSTWTPIHPRTPRRSITRPSSSGPFIHADGAGRSREGLLVYEGDPLERDLEIAGHPILVLRLASSSPDSAVVAYLEDGTPRLFRRGHRIRLSLAGADVDHFVTPPSPPGARVVWRIDRKGSRLLLPTMR